MRKQESIFNQVMEQALPLIHSCLDDLLVHDRDRIDAHAGVPFLHFTGETGTYILMLIPFEEDPKAFERAPYLFSSADRYHILSGMVGMVKHMPIAKRNDLVLYYNGNGAVQRIDQKRAESVMDEYAENLRDQFCSRI